MHFGKSDKSGKHILKLSFDKCNAILDSIGGFEWILIYLLKSAKFSLQALKTNSHLFRITLKDRMKLVINNH